VPHALGVSFYAWSSCGISCFCCDYS
jgi:hypothetical protein